jgi:predicted nuclease of restriction endonuclease-like (RecB) superfamily
MKPTKRTARRSDVMPAGYARFLSSLKGHIRKAQVKAVLSVNEELVRLYWRIGKEIVTRQKKEGWGSKVVDRLADDLHKEFPEMSGLSARSLNYMHAFAEAYTTPAILQQAAAKLPWGHNMVLLDRLKTLEQRQWYANATLRFGWSRSILAAQISAKAHKRHGKAITNFKHTLPAGTSDLVQETFKDEYRFGFIELSLDAKERDLEKALLEHIRKFLIELGVGFAFVGSQVPFEVDGEGFSMDLLFFHYRLNRFVVVDLKMGAFKSEYVGKMGLYLGVVDDRFRMPGHEPSVGILLCQDSKGLSVDYALNGSNKPIGVADWRTKLVSTLPKNLRGLLPSPEQIEEKMKKPKRSKGK